MQVYYENQSGILTTGTVLKSPLTGEPIVHPRYGILVLDERTNKRSYQKHTFQTVEQYEKLKQRDVFRRNRSGTIHPNGRRKRATSKREPVAAAGTA